MENNYFSYLDFRAAQRQLAARFARPHGLLLHSLAFVTAMTAIWYYMIATGLLMYSDNFRLPVLIGVVWSMILLAHAVDHYRRSPALVEQREVAVETEMRGLIEKNGAGFDHDTLFTMHNRLETLLEGQGRWARALLAFALINFLSWGLSAFTIGTSWPFQMTLPSAVLLIGGVNLFLRWQAARTGGEGGWLTRFPLRHIALYGVSMIALAVAGAYRMVNPWDVNTVVQVWGVALLLHIIFSIVVQPLIERFLQPQPMNETPAKRKVPARLVLADDGEVLDINDQDVSSTSTAYR